MIVYELKTLLQKKRVFFIICYSIHSEFITEAATDKVLQKSWSEIAAKKLGNRRKFFWFPTLLK